MCRGTDTITNKIIHEARALRENNLWRGSKNKPFLAVSDHLVLNRRYENFQNERSGHPRPPTNLLEGLCDEEYDSDHSDRGHSGTRSTGRLCDHYATFPLCSLLTDGSRRCHIDVVLGTRA